MKRVLVLSALVLLVLSFGVASAQTHKVTLDHVVGVDKTNGLTGGSEVEFHIRAINSGNPQCMYNTSFGFSVYSEDGATWGTTTIEPALIRIDTIDVQGQSVPKPVTFANLFTQTFSEGQGVDGKMADSVGYSGLTMGGGDPGVRDGLDNVILVIKIKPNKDAKGKHICLDRTVAMPSYEWEWSGLGVDPKKPCSREDAKAEWDGPFCFEVH